MPLSWSKEKVPAQELPRGHRAGAHEHVHHCGCGRYAMCSSPLDKCDEPDECPDCIDDQVDRETGAHA